MGLGDSRNGGELSGNEIGNADVVVREACQQGVVEGGVLRRGLGLREASWLMGLGRRASGGFLPNIEGFEFQVFALQKLEIWRIDPAPPREIVPAPGYRYGLSGRRIKRWGYFPSYRY